MSSQEFRDVKLTRLKFSPSSRKDIGEGMDSEDRKFHFPALVVLRAGDTIAKGTKVTVQARPPDPGDKHSDTWRVIDIKNPNSDRRWSDWQRLGLVKMKCESKSFGLPDTKPREFVALVFGCSNCGTIVIEPDDIFKIKGGCIWTKGTPKQDTVEPYNPGSEWNRVKDTMVQFARCTCCHANVGSYYPDPYKSDKDGKTFPCYKLTFRRTVKEDSLYVAQHLVLCGAQSDVVAELERLYAGGNGILSSVRTNVESHETMQQLQQTAEQLSSISLEWDRFMGEREENARQREALLENARQSELKMKLLTQRKWQAEVAPDDWQAVPDMAALSLEQGHRATYSIGDQRFHADPTEMVVRQEGRSDADQRLRVTLGDDLSLLGLMRISRPCDEIWPNDVRVYHLLTPGESADVTQDVMHYGLATSRFTAMMAKLQPVRPTEAALIDNPALRERYKAKREAYARDGKPVNEVWAFHRGEREEDVNKILQDGFSVEGGVAQGAMELSHGPGVYIAVRSDVALLNHPNLWSLTSYKKLILAKVLVGRLNEDTFHLGHMRRFVSADQVLPLYTISYDVLDVAESAGSMVAQPPPSAVPGNSSDEP
jgi:hypothetical protein